MSETALLERATAARQAGEYTAMAATLTELAELYAKTDRPDESARAYREAADGHARTGDGQNEAVCYAALGRLAADRGDHKTAHLNLTRARTIQSVRADLAALVPTLHALARLERSRGNDDTADELSADANRFQILVNLE